MVLLDALQEHAAPVLCVTTCGPKTLHLVRRLFESAKRIDGLRIICVFQGVFAEQVVRVRQEFSQVVPLHTSDRSSLSAARNRALLWAQNAMGEHHFARLVLGFPDDDAELSSEGISVVRRHFSHNEGMLAGRFRSSEGVISRGPEEFTVNQVGPREIFRWINSNSMYVDGATVLSVGLFDEEFGVGAKYGSGEDVDYGIRCLVAMRPLIVTSKVLAVHPVKQGQIQRYYAGSLALLAKHFLINHDHRYLIMFGRRAINGIRLVATDQLAFCVYRRAVVQSLAKLLTFFTSGTPWSCGTKPEALFAERLTRRWEPNHAVTAVTWFNHYTALQSLIRAHVNVEVFDYVGIDGLLLGKLLGNRVQRTSADLVLPLLLNRLHGARVAVVGGSEEGALARARALDALLHGSSKVVDIIDGFSGLIRGERLVDRLINSGVNVVIIGSGAPLQDELALDVKSRLPWGLVLTCGGFLDQLLVTNYYPNWAYQLRLNWAVRLAREPKRLWRRYTLDALKAIWFQKRIRAHLQPFRVTTGFGYSRGMIP